MDFTSEDLKIHVIESLDATKVFGNARHADGNS
jgi:hypothetical protein